VSDHDPQKFAYELSARLATRSRHVCAFLGSGVARACGLPDVVQLQTQVLGALTGDDRKAFEEQLKGRNLEQLDLDPPDHTRLRSLVHKAFTPSVIEQIRSRTQTIVDELLDCAMLLGEMDLIRDFALPLPMTIITETLEPTKDHNKFHRWSQAWCR
jgi:cytochrome P450